MSDNWKEEVRKLAYVKWKQAGCPNGDDKKFWYEAEKEMINGYLHDSDDSAQTIGLSKSEY